MMLGENESFGAFEILCSFQEKVTEHMLSDLICRTDNLSEKIKLSRFSRQPDPKGLFDSSSR
ncbi:hypothetical protein BPJM79_40286 [Bacillus pumilus]|nr:hypothetical protein C6X98_06670 [Bacillus pumilus]